jgi:G6PDH family F420-dependent oxidoreductase
MTRFGYFLSCEDFPPAELVEQARMAEAAGFEALWISDHFHPWIAAQGHAPCVWSVIGALSQATRLPVTTAVTCPTVRMHPAVVAHAAATAAAQLEGRFVLGVGSGEALNEHVVAQRWPQADVRLEMLEEAVGLIRALFTGDEVSWHGRHYQAENARLYTRPDGDIPIYVSGFGPKAVSLAARIADGYVSATPDAELLAQYRNEGGRGPAQGGVRVCWGREKEAAVRLAHRLWPIAGLPGELNQVLPSPAHFEQAATLVTPDAIASSMACGPDVEEHIRALRSYVDAGYDEVYVAQVGPEQQEFFEAYARDVLPELRRAG